MATAVQTLQNFIDGAPVDPAQRRDQDRSSTRPPGEEIAHTPLSGPEDVDRAVAAARARLRRRLGTTTHGRGRARAAAARRLASRSARSS